MFIVSDEATRPELSVSRPKTISSTVDTLRRAPVGPLRAACVSGMFAIGTPLCAERSTVRLPAASEPERLANVAGALGAVTAQVLEFRSLDGDLERGERVAHRRAPRRHHRPTS